jgi:murein DD-endopeptidase MepM/ murein hydrolase activator NlpD
VPVTAQSAAPSGSSLATPTPAVIETPAAPTPAPAAPAATPAPVVAAAPAASSSRMQMPVQGAIIRPYVKKKNDGIDIAAAPGTAVQAAADGTVAAITKDTEQVPILVLRHDNGLLTVYANLDGITVAKGASVKRGQTIAKVRAGDPGFLHFEVRDGFDSVDPTPYVK